MFRLLKFLGVFFLLVGIIFLLVVYPNRDAFLVVFRNGDALAEGADWAMKAKSVKGIADFINENPQYVSYLSTRNDSLRSDSLALNADTPRTMGMLSSVLLIRMLFEKHQDDINGLLATETSWADIKKLQLPMVYQTSHENAEDRLQKEGHLGESGMIQNRFLLQSMLLSADLATHDYFLNQFSPNEIRQYLQQWNMMNTQAPVPLLAAYLHISPKFHRQEVGERERFLNTQTTSERNAAIWEVHEKLQSDEVFRFKAQSFTEDEGKGLKFDEERDFNRYFPQTTARDLHRFIASMLSSDNPVDQSFVEFIQQTNEGNYRDRVFSSYAGVFDNRIGLQNGIDWGSSLEGDQHRIQTFFFDDLPVSFWFHLSSDLILQDIQQRMIWDPELRAILPND